MKRIILSTIIFSILLLTTGCGSINEEIDLEKILDSKEKIEEKMKKNIEATDEKIDQFKSVKETIKNEAKELKNSKDTVDNIIENIK